MSSLSSKNYLLAIAVKTYAKADVRAFWFCPAWFSYFLQNILSLIVYNVIIFLILISKATIWTSARINLNEDQNKCSANPLRLFAEFMNHSQNLWKHPILVKGKQNPTFFKILPYMLRIHQTFFSWSSTLFYTTSLVRLVFSILNLHLLAVSKINERN